MKQYADELAPLAYSITEAMRVSSLGRTKLYELINRGMIDTVKIDRRTLIKAPSLHRLIDNGS